MERDEYARLRLSLKKIKEEVSFIEQTIQDIKISKITEGLTYAEWAASHGNEPSVEDTLERIGTNKEKSINSLFDELNKIGIKVKSMRNESNRLEELFIEMIKK